MKRRPASPPGPLAQSLSKVVRTEIDSRYITQSALAGRIEKSRTYISERINDAVTWTMNDVEDIAGALDLEVHDVFLRALRIYETEKQLDTFASDFVVQFLRDMAPPADPVRDEREIRERYQQWVAQQGQ